MGKILQAFLTNQIHVNSAMETRSLGHQKLCGRSSELHDKLAERLNDKEKEILAELVDTIFDESCYETDMKFEQGFRLGVLMAAEIFTEQDMFLRGDDRHA